MTETLRQTTTVIVRPVVAIVHSSPVARVTAVRSTAGVPGKDAAKSRRELLTVVTNGQTVFQLQEIAKQPELSNLSFNGVKALYGSDYIINEVLLTWLSAIPFTTDDQLEILYL